MTNEQIQIATERKRLNDKKVKDELEKVDIAIFLCQNCSLGHMRYLKNSVLVSKNVLLNNTEKS